MTLSLFISLCALALGGFNAYSTHLRKRTDLTVAKINVQDHGTSEDTIVEYAVANGGDLDTLIHRFEARLYVHPDSAITNISEVGVWETDEATVHLPSKSITKLVLKIDKKNLKSRVSEDDLNKSSLEIILSASSSGKKWYRVAIPEDELLNAILTNSSQTVIHPQDLRVALKDTTSPNSEELRLFLTRCLVKPICDLYESVLVPVFYGAKEFWCKKKVLLQSRFRKE